MLYVKNGSERLKKELIELKTKNPELLKLLVDLYHWVDSTYKKDVIITMIFRTDEEQAQLYKDDPKYQAKPFKSPHQFWAGCDLRSSLYTEAEIAGIENYLNKKHNPINYHAWTARNHKIIGSVEHFHLQYLLKK